jgi:hypothetical protein
MSAHDQANAKARQLPLVAPLLLVTASLFLSAGLMFTVELMVAKMVLPNLGGAPAVWSTCLLFFQAVLLLGYTYAHVMARRLTTRMQVMVHVGLLIPLAAMILPIGLGSGTPTPEDWPVLWLLVHLATGVGLPVFVISATSPLLQSWFSRLDHPAAEDPYFLYAGSNVGSLLGLILYPFLVEPNLSLSLQALIWSLAFAGLAVLVALCGLLTMQATASGCSRVVTEAFRASNLWDRLRWTALAFIPSSMLLGVTSHITSDIAAVPLLWVIPLALYLLTFILAFARRPLVRHATVLRLLPFPLIATVISMVFGAQTTAIQLVLHLGSFFMVGLACHGELARRRPPATHLTEFFFFLSLGGVLGGVFNALIAPVLFPEIWEYPLIFVAACFVMPNADHVKERRIGDFVLPLLLGGVAVLVEQFVPQPGSGSRIAMVCGGLVLAMALLNFSARRLRFALGVGACLLAPLLSHAETVLMTDRSFFGVYRIVAKTEGDAHFLVLMDGTTIHGAKSLRPGEERLPTTYYGPAGPFALFLKALPEDARRIAVVGLGAGSLSCYAKPEQAWTFYEIDPLVERIARDPRYFDFLSKCGTNSRVVLGDARLTLAQVPDASYDALIIDAFSSDNIPMHLLTREALALYRRKLAPGGRILFHISSRMLDLRPVIASLAADAGLEARLIADRRPRLTLYQEPAVAVAVGARQSGLDGLDSKDGWTPLPNAGTRYLWTDDRSDILSVIRLGFK